VRWLIDECVDAALIARLRQLGHDVVYMSDVAPRASDVEVMNRADREKRLLLTEDKDFYAWRDMSRRRTESTRLTQPDIWSCWLSTDPMAADRPDAMLPSALQPARA
jgi:predicted nuclease of predicted toxin-antitoxin system